MRHKYVANDLNFLNMASMCGGRLKYLRNSFTVEFDKWLIYVGNDVYMWEMAEVFQKRLKYVENDVDLWEMAQICWEVS